jgi:hypothetical protein
VLWKIDSEVYFRCKNINLEGLGEILGGEIEKLMSLDVYI